MELNNHPINIVRFYPNQSPENFKTLINAYLKLFNNKNNLRFLSLSNKPFDSNTIATFLKNSPAEEVEYYVAFSSDKDIIGIAAFENDLIKGLNIIGIVVDVKHRNKGLGKAFINKGMEIAHKKGFKAIDISVFADNKSMLILLLKLDFKPIRIESHTRFDGEDLVHLKRYL
jgi:ribosomal protein S18 acetylase RimI-like enzyme